MTNYVEDIMQEIYAEIDGEMVNVKDIKPEDIYKNLDIRDMPNEKWMEFHEGKLKVLFVSNLGRIKTIAKHNGKEMIRKQKIDRNGRPYISINDNTALHVSRLVAKGFISNPNNLPVVCHNNNKPKDNRTDNLRWDTYSNNTQQAHDDGLIDIRQSAIVLNSNGDVIAQHDGMGEALSHYDGKQTKYNKDIHIVGNVIVMKQAHYKALTEDEIFSISYDCFQRMIEYAYVVDGQYAETTETAQLIGCSKTYPNMLTKDKLSATYNGHTVSRLKNMIGVGG